MDYKQLRRVLRERLDASGTKADETHMQAAEEAPAAVQELPAHDLPVNIAAMIGDEMVDPPVNDAEFLPGNLQQLQHAANVLVQNVPPLQVQDFYHKLRRLVTTSIRQQNRSGEDQTDMMPEPSPDQELERANQEEANAEDKVDVTVAERIRRIAQTQVTEHRVRRAVKRVLNEQYGADVGLDIGTKIALLSDPDTYDGILPSEFKKLTKGIPASDWPDMANAYQALLDDENDDQPAERAATGKTGAEDILLKKIADDLGCGVSGVRNIIGRFYEDLGVAYAGGDRARIAAYQKVVPGADALFDIFTILALMKYYDHAELEKPVNVKGLISDIANATFAGSSALALGGLTALKPNVSVETFVDAKNSFISNYLQDEFDEKKFTGAYQGERGMETFTSRSGKESTRPSRDPEDCFKAIKRTTEAFVKDYNETMAAANKWAESGVLPTGGNVARWLSLLPEFSG
jgi:hypothetical protein